MLLNTLLRQNIHSLRFASRDKRLAEAAKRAFSSLKTETDQTSLAAQKTETEKAKDPKKPVLDEISQKLISSFFDVQDNWKKSDVTTGRPWRIEELRIKSNEDLHTLWYVLYKERNMLMTMQQAAKDNVEHMASPERIDKVEESMKNIEEVVKERNKAYFDLEVGDSSGGQVERPRVFRRDIFGRYAKMASSQHLIPYWMNTTFRNTRGQGFGPDVKEFNIKLNEKKANNYYRKRSNNRIHVRQLLRRFPNIDLEYLQELYPEVDVKDCKDNLAEYLLKDRKRTFHKIFYQEVKNF